MEIRKKSRLSSALIAGFFAIGVAVVPMAKADTVTLQIEDYYTAGSGPEGDALHAALSACATTYGATANIVSVPGGDLNAKVLQQSSSKTLPDILMLDNPDVASFASTVALLPLSQFGITAAGYA